MGTLLTIISIIGMTISLHKSIDLVELMTLFCIMLIGHYVRGLEKKKKINQEADEND